MSLVFFLAILGNAPLTQPALLKKIRVGAADELKRPGVLHLNLLRTPKPDILIPKKGRLFMASLEITAMAETIMITIPDAPKEREEVLRFLESKGLVKREEVKEQHPDQPKQSRWARLAQKMSEENYLSDGLGDEFRRGCREFRENFVFKSEPTADGL